MTTKTKVLFKQWPFTQHTVGFDTLEKFFTEDKPKPNFPPYNIIKIKNDYIISVALAGYSAETISIQVDKRILSVHSNGYCNSPDTEERKYIHKGIAKRAFDIEFALGENIEVEKSKMKDGILEIYLQHTTPEDTSQQINIETE